MDTLTRAAVMGILAVALGCGTAPPRGPSGERMAVFEALFCPSCAAFNDETLPLNRSGECLVCGRAPVLVRGCSVAWYWCRNARNWKYIPCRDDAACCAPRTSTALTLPRTNDDTRRPVAYCPECRRVRGPEWPPEGDPRCAVCAQPTVCAAAVQETWFWCADIRDWRRERCVGHAGCCAVHSPYILACICGPATGPDVLAVHCVALPAQGRARPASH